MSEGGQPISRDPSKPAEFADRYRLYLDESGDHVFRQVSEPAHRFLCLVGCWFQNPDYLVFHRSLEELKTQLLPHHPDEPVVLHREDMLNARRAFKALRDPNLRSQWDEQLLELIAKAEFRCVAVVIDKVELRNDYGDAAAHPYHLGLGFCFSVMRDILNTSVVAGTSWASREEAQKTDYLRIPMSEYTSVACG